MSSRLFKAIIIQALEDLASRTKNAEYIFHRKQAHYWIFEQGPYFKFICLHADIDPSSVIKAAEKILIDGKFWQAEYGRGKRFVDRKRYREREKSRLMLITPSSSSLDDPQGLKP